MGCSLGVVPGLQLSEVQICNYPNGPVSLYSLFKKAVLLERYDMPTHCSTDIHSDICVMVDADCTG